jgi:redox-sensitive bicupin YhaK (pirin superfamily)
MSTRPIKLRISSMEVSEGAGVTVRRSLGLPSLRHLDPFLMLDHFSTENPDDYIAGFPDHPHRGFVTLTYMIDGHMLHQDSMGNRGDLRPGGAQWMKAASGVIHSEMPQQSEGLMRGFQLWINLPAAEKMSDPAYQEFSRDVVPDVQIGDARIRVISGELSGVRGPVDDPHTGVQFLDITLGPAATASIPTEPSAAAFIYVFEGVASIAGIPVATHELAALGEGRGLELSAGEAGARAILVVGRPLHEPIVQYGPFVMNTMEEVAQAFADLREGRLVRKRGSVVAV